MTETRIKDVAIYFVYFAAKHGDWLTNLKLQKLVYYAQAWYLALYGKPLFQEQLQAWTHGPANPSLWHAYKHHGWNPIPPIDERPSVSPKVGKHIEEVFSVYGGMSAYDLERLTHCEAPWIKARDGTPEDEPSDAVISHATMKRFYRDMADEKKTRTGR